MFPCAPFNESTLEQMICVQPTVYVVPDGKTIPFGIPLGTLNTTASFSLSSSKYPPDPKSITQGAANGPSYRVPGG